MTMTDTEILPKGQGTRCIAWEGFSLRGDDGRTLEGMIVPYGQVAEVTELDPDTNQLVRYQEQFLKGSLARMEQGFRSRGLLDVPLLLSHTDDTIQNRIGFATSMESRSDGAWATFRIYEDTNLTKTLSMLRESHTGLSVAFRDTRPPKLVDGVVSRVQVFVGHVAATPTPTYATAGITAMRADDQDNGRPLLDEVRQWLQSQKETNHG